MIQLKPQATYDDFLRLDIRIGKVVEVQPFPRARNPSYKVAVDVGADRIMWSSAQITNYEPEALVGTLMVCVCNLGAKNIAGFTAAVSPSESRSSSERLDLRRSAIFLSPNA
jgi:tRNA-binding protein